MACGPKTSDDAACVLRITNISKKSVLAERASVAKSFLSRAKGLMFARKPHALILQAARQSIRATSIHMFFMLFPIDVVWADEHKRVIDLFESAKPFALKTFKPASPAKYVIELPVGSIRESGTSLGDELSW